MKEDVIAAVEGCYQLEGDLDQWLRRLGEAFLPLVDQGLGAEALATRRPHFGRIDIVTCQYLGPPATREFQRRQFDELGPEGREIAFRWVPVVDVARESMRKLGMDPRDYERRSPPGYTFADHMTLIARDGSTEAVAVNAFSERPIELAPAKRRMLRKLTWHIGAGWRLMRSSLAATEEAVLEVGGRCVHATAGAQSRDAREALRDAVRAVDRARSSRGRRDPAEALRLWQGLVKGRWSLVDRFESDGRRYVIAHRNDPTYEDPRQLTDREQQCARLAAAGYSGGEVAYALGLGESTARSHIQSAMRKLGLGRRQQLTEVLEPAALARTRVAPLRGADDRLVAASTPTAPPSEALSGLTEAERAVTRALLRGDSSRDIAATRGTSERTVANQVQSIYRKLGVSSRAELAAELQRRSSPTR